MSTTTDSSTTVQQARIDTLLDRCRREVDAGLLPSCQVAVGFEGDIVAQATFGDATDQTRYCVFSATKPFVASTMWQLISEGLVELDATVASYLPQFGENAKEAITVEQVMLHTSGFPHAPLGPPQWDTSESRLVAMANWRLNWAPGTRYEYHPTSAHWVLGEIITAVTGNDFRDEVHHRVTAPLGLPRLLGLARDEQKGIAELVLVGDPATPDELEATFGVRELPPTEVTNEVILRFNEPSVREVGVPGGGAYGTAADLALFYQGLLHNPDELWEPAMLAKGTGEVRNTMPDPMGMPANRSIGLFVAGDDGMANLRGLGRTVSPSAFGHNGAGGQLAWADPATGLSLGYTTNGYDEHEVRQPRRDTAICSLAGLCTTP
ncbi:serine hydrolase domain-containing protein [Candidatus Poriferisodalis sp.]|uniref:serine hydrolase domain-containing protein n=1 Tax=Candidatus Poriferisodalis sp. TaxID=3101277 RepID=UPI003B014718